jgi:hypothetical protein
MGLIQSIFNGIAAGRAQKQRHDEYTQLLYTPFLHSSSYLEELADKAKTKGELEIILDHMYRHHATEYSYLDEKGEERTETIENYHKLEWFIINHIRGKNK